MLALIHMLLPLLMRGSSLMNAHALHRELATSVNYTTFGVIESFSLNNLELRVLNRLCKHVILLTNPVQPRADMDLQLYIMSARNREIFVITSLLVAHDPLELLHQLLYRSGYAVQCLLAKLFSPVYIEFLVHDKERPKCSCAFTGYLSHLLSSDKHGRKLRLVNAVLEQAESCELSKTLLQYTSAWYANNFSFDYAIFTLAKERKYSQIPDVEYNHLLRHWLHHASRTQNLIPFVADYLRIMLLPSVLSECKQSMLKKMLVSFVASKDDEKYLELLEAFDSIWSIKTYVAEFVSGSHNYSISPHFILNYLGCPRMNWKSMYDPLITNFWAAYLKSPEHFVAMKNAWCENRYFFNRIGHMWLRDFFRALLKGGSKLRVNRDEAMNKYMNMLEFDTFLNIMKITHRFSQRALLNYMLESLNAISRKLYLFEVRGSKKLHSSNEISTRRRNQIIRKLKYMTAQAQCDDYRREHGFGLQQDNKEIEKESANLATSITENVRTRLSEHVNRKQKPPVDCQEIIEILDDSE
ncbi:hypothetical protein PAPHI01_0375 [Pancytospora philotis]|nr:hypothetical protein PAPHI01_0349 [Pancytospora philotis]KAI4291101.1 hypothetical protein PAPHI01_0375 [Pancytospora philotis]